MAEQSKGDQTRNLTEFERLQQHAVTVGPIREFWYYLRHSRKWWMAPIIVSLLLVSGLIVLGGTSLAPLIYTLF